MYINFPKEKHPRVGDRASTKYIIQRHSDRQAARLR